MEKSIQLFSNSDQEKNATLVQFCDGRIYAAAEDSCLTQLDLDLNVQKVLGQKIDKEIFALVATRDYVAVGGRNCKVTVYGKGGDLALVSYFCLILSLQCVSVLRQYFKCQFRQKICLIMETQSKNFD